MDFSYPAIQEQALNNLPNNKQATELPPQALYASAQVQNGTGNVLWPGSTDSDSLQPQPSGVPDINPTPPHRGEESRNEDGSTFVEELTPQSPDIRAHPLPGANYIQNWPETTPVTAPPSVFPTGSLVDGDTSQQAYWTVDPFQNLTPSQRPQELVSTHTLSLLEPVPGSLSTLLVFCLDTTPRLIYLHLLLRLPRLYFSRLTRIFHDAELSLPEMQKLALVAWAQRHGVGHYLSPPMGPELNPTYSSTQTPSTTLNSTGKPSSSR